MTKLKNIIPCGRYAHIIKVVKRCFKKDFDETATLAACTLVNHERFAKPLAAEDVSGLVKLVRKGLLKNKLK